MTGITANSIDCTQDTKEIINDHLEMISISLSRIEREFDEVPEKLESYIADVDAAITELNDEHFKQ